LCDLIPALQRVHLVSASVPVAWLALVPLSEVACLTGV